MEDSDKQTILQLIAAVPMGRFTTVRDLAEAARLPSANVSAFLARLGRTERDFTPWHRVVPEGGSLDLADGAEQRRLLAFEGVGFDGPRLRDFDSRRHRFRLEA